MTESCPKCGGLICRSDLPDGTSVIVDASSVQAVTIIDVESKREPRVQTCWPLHQCNTAAKSG